MNKLADTSDLTLEHPLAPLESARLEALEQTIADGARHFIAVGQALLEIRDSRLYREDFKTFDAYCDARWDFTRQYAGNLIRAYGVAENLETIGFEVETERQARLFSALEPVDQRVVAQVVRAVTGKDRPSSAEITAFAETVQKLHNTGYVTHPDTLEEVPWDELPEPARMSVLKANVSESTYQQVVHNQSLGSWTDALLNHAQTLGEGQEIVVRIYRDEQGNPRVRARVELVREYGEVLAEGEEKKYLKRAALSLLEEVAA